MREPWVRTTGNGGTAVFICAYGSQTCGRPASYQPGRAAAITGDQRRIAAMPSRSNSETSRLTAAFAAVSSRAP